MNNGQTLWTSTISEQQIEYLETMQERAIDAIREVLKGKTVKLRNGVSVGLLENEIWITGRPNRLQLSLLIQAIYLEKPSSGYRFTAQNGHISLTWGHRYEGQIELTTEFGNLEEKIKAKEKHYHSGVTGRKKKGKKMARDSGLEDRQEVEISCPNCGAATKLQVRTNKANGNQFLGCPNWPGCSHTQSIPEYFYIKASGQKTLFD